MNLSSLVNQAWDKMKGVPKPDITLILSAEDEILFVVSIENDIFEVLDVRGSLFMIPYQHLYQTDTGRLKAKQDKLLPISDESLSTKGIAHKLNSALLSVEELETSDRTKKDALYEAMRSIYHTGFQYFEA